jgi:hypothetical protein
MRLTGCLLITTAAIGLAGCSTLVSVHPFIAGPQAVFDPALVGVWAGDNNDALYVIRQDGNSYKIRRMEGTDATSFSAQLFKNGDLRILDLMSAADDPFQLAVHTPLRVWVEGATLRFATLDSAWLMENARKQLAVEDVGDRALITAPGDAVLRFLITYGGADNAYGKPSVLYKQP